MAAHAHSNNKFTEDEKCHNLMSWLNYFVIVKVALAYACGWFSNNTFPLYELSRPCQEITLTVLTVMTRRQVLRYKSVTLKYVGHENAGYIKFSVFALYNFRFL